MGCDRFYSRWGAPVKRPKLQDRPRGEATAPLLRHWRLELTVENFTE